VLDLIFIEIFDWK